MKCRYCKAEIPEGELYCKKCGREVQIVPDYNPLEEMLTAQIQLDGNEQGSELDQYINQKRRKKNRTGPSAGRNTGRSASRTTAAMTGRRMTGNTTGQMLTEKERRKRQSAKAARKKALRRKRRIVLLIMAAIVVLAGAGFYVVYQNSYNGIMKKAQKAAQSKDYTTAEAYYKLSIERQEPKILKKQMPTQFLQMFISHRIRQMKVQHYLKKQLASNLVMLNFIKHVWIFI